MIYKDLTLDQRISLKGEFKTNPKLYQYYAIMILWNFVTAVEYFLSDDDIEILYRYLKKHNTNLF